MTPEHTHVEKAIDAHEGNGLAQIYLHARSWRKKKKSIAPAGNGVPLFLLLTKINLASKLIYVVLSLAWLLIFSLLQIGLSYKPERRTFLQSHVLENAVLKLTAGVFAGDLHVSSGFFCSVLVMRLARFDLLSKARFSGAVITFANKESLSAHSTLLALLLHPPAARVKLCKIAVHKKSETKRANAVFVQLCRDESFFLSLK